MDVLEGTPWKLNPEADEAEAVLSNLDEQICMPAEVVTERPRYLEREIVPRRVMITVFVVGQFGPSPSCMGCHFLCVGGELTSPHPSLQVSNHHAHGRDAACASRVECEWRPR